MLRVELSSRAEKFLQRLPLIQRNRVEQSLQNLASDSVPSDSKFLGRDERGNRVFRVRIGDYRALYNIREEAGAVIIIVIDKRERVYHR